MVLRLNIPSDNFHIIGILIEVTKVGNLCLVLLFRLLLLLLLGLKLLQFLISCPTFVLGRKVDGLHDVSILLLLKLLLLLALWKLVLLLYFEFDALKTDPCGISVYIHIKRMFTVGTTSLLLLLCRYALHNHCWIRQSLHPEYVSFTLMRHLLLLELLGWYVSIVDSNDLLLLLMGWRRDIRRLILMKILMLAGGSYFRA